jgi:hypothetical protein
MVGVVQEPQAFKSAVKAHVFTLQILNDDRFLFLHRGVPVAIFVQLEMFLHDLRVLFRFFDQLHQSFRGLLARVPVKMKKKNIETTSKQHRNNIETTSKQQH